MEYRVLTEEEKSQIDGQVLLQGQLVIGAVEDGKVHAACGLVNVVHLDPVWVAPERRKSMFLLRRLWEAVSNALFENGIYAVTGSIINGVPPKEDEEVVIKLMERLAGGTELDGRFWLMPIGK